MCWLEFVIRWIDAVYEKPAKVGEGSSTAERQTGPLAPPGDAGSNPVLVPIPEFYLRPELIPIKEPNKAEPVVREAERVVRSGH